MNCEKFELLLQDCLDNDIDIENTIESKADLASHLSSCAGCAQLTESFKTLGCGIEAMRAESFEIDIVDRVVPLITPASKTPIATRSNWYIVAAVVSCLAIIVTLGSFLISSSNPNNLADGSADAGNGAKVNGQNQPGNDANRPGQNETLPVPDLNAIGESLAIMNLNRIPRVAETIEALRPYYLYTQNLPGIRPVSSSLTITVDVLRRSMENQNQPKRSDGTPGAHFQYASIHWV